jgi:hypothetical protein
MKPCPTLALRSDLVRKSAIKIATALRQLVHDSRPSYLSLWLHEPLKQAFKACECCICEGLPDDVCRVSSSDDRARPLFPRALKDRPMLHSPAQGCSRASLLHCETTLLRSEDLLPWAEPNPDRSALMYPQQVDDILSAIVFDPSRHPRASE